ncbi:MAG TPA: YfhO family protein [Candidatus Hydrogenedentes bacterium]|nr:YfhO family protein [Candidatus Hydrogenedentota bacterium]HQE82297.1 YfhO family protein [Candidatus Hydrogenedentota bacterium]HQM48951.1 YfhO family protein [Candidatus Hydrogenedentota bacterium]
MHDRLDRTPPALGWRELLMHALVLLALLAILFPGVAFRGELALPGGWLTTVPPWSQNMPPEAVAPKNWLTNEVFVFFTKTYFVTQEALKAGEWPLWNNYEMMGMPQLANYQSNPFYPARLLHAFLGIYAATSLTVLLRLWLCGMNAYICGRGIGLHPGTSRFFSLAWMLSSFNLLWAYWPVPDNAAWAPLLFLGAEWLLRDRSRRGFALLTVSATLTLLTGHPETAFAFGLGLGVYFLLRVIWMAGNRQPVGRAVLLALGAWAIAILIAVVVIVPFLEYVANSNTAGSRDKSDFDKRFFPFAGLIALWVPRFFGSTVDGNFWSELEPRFINSTFVSLVYPGIAVWCGITALFARGRRSFRPMTVSLMVPAVLAFLMSLDLTFMHPIQEFSTLNAMWRCWYVVFPAFALPLLAAIGLEQWNRRPRKWRHAGVAALLLAVPVAVVFATKSFYAPLMQSFGIAAYVQREVMTFVVLIGVCAGLFIASVRLLPPRLFVFLLTVVLAGDLIYAARDYHPTAPRSWVFPETETTRFLKGQAPAPRVGVVTAGINPGLFPQCGIEQLWGYDGIYPQRNIEFLGRLGLPTAEAAAPMEPVCSVRFYLHDPEQPPRMPYDDPDRFRLVLKADGLEVYENLRAFPRAFLVAHAETAENLDVMFDKMMDPSFDPRKTCLLESPLPAPLPASENAAAGHAEVLKRSNNEVVIEAQAGQDCILVLTDAYYPGWRASVDGARTDVFPAYGLFRAVRVSEGRHTIQFRFTPWSFRLGMAISTATLSFAFLGALWQLRRLSAQAINTRGRVRR